MKMPCHFCGKLYMLERGGLNNHQKYCKLNPDRKDGFNKGRDGWNKGKTAAEDNRIVSGDNHPFSKKLWGASLNGHSEETKLRLSIAAKARNLGGHTSKTKIYFEKKNGDKIFLQSSYEIEFAKILEKLNIEWSRPDPLNWIDEHGKSHRYYPDFKIDDLYFDTKNDYLAIKDLPKIESVRKQNNVIVFIVTKDKISEEFILDSLEHSSNL